MVALKVPRPMWGGIIAAGSGSRLRQGGWTVPKPMVTVAGIPLLERVMGNFQAAGITSLVMIFNDEHRDCERWARARFPHLDLDIIVKTTASSLESFLEVTGHLGSNPALISTVDAWCYEKDFVSFVRAATQYPSDALVLGVTPFVDDERPLWVQLDPTGRVTSLGEKSGNVVTTGMYLVPPRIRRLSVPDGMGRLREFLTWVVKEGLPVYAVLIHTVVDVDRPEDVATAEKLENRILPAGHERGQT